MSSEFRLSRRHAVYAAEVLLAGTLTFNLTGCSVLLPFSAVRANHRFPKGELALARFEKLPGHPRIRIVTAAGDTVSGHFGSIRPMPISDYAPRYEAWIRTVPSTFPALDEEIRIKPQKGRMVSGNFAGFGVKSIWLRHGRWVDEEYPLDGIASLRPSSGVEPRLDSLMAMAERNELPSRGLVRLTQASGTPSGAQRIAGKNDLTVMIPVNDVRAVIIEGWVASPPAAFVGGLGLDALVLLGIAAAVASSMNSGCDGSGITFGSGY